LSFLIAGFSSLVASIKDKKLARYIARVRIPVERPLVYKKSLQLRLDYDQAAGYY
jgi:hypothetical protein